MGQLAEAVSRVDPKDVTIRRLEAAHPEFAETAGLLGRAYKQIFFAAGDRTGAAARDALRQAIAMYRAPLHHDPDGHTWHGVNLLALLTRARRLCIEAAPDLQPLDVARRLVEALGRIPADRRGEWHLPTLAEASLGQGGWSGVEQAIRACAGSKDASAFLVASTLRQLTEVWDLESVDERGRSLVASCGRGWRGCPAAVWSWSRRGCNGCGTSPAPWEVVALHHEGGTMGMPRLNGTPGSYAANEGLALAAMQAEAAASWAGTPGLAWSLRSARHPRDRLHGATVLLEGLSQALPGHLPGGHDAGGQRRREGPLPHARPRHRQPHPEPLRRRGDR